MNYEQAIEILRDIKKQSKQPLYNSQFHPDYITMKWGKASGEAISFAIETLERLDRGEKLCRGLRLSRL